MPENKDIEIKTSVDNRDNRTTAERFVGKERVAAEQSSAVVRVEDIEQSSDLICAATVEKSAQSADVSLSIEQVDGNALSEPVEQNATSSDTVAQNALSETETSSAPSSDVAVAFDNVSFYYKSYNDDGTVGRAVGVENVTLSIKKGTFVALVGHNGCGKSTLAKLVNGLLIPAEGTVKVFGADTAKDNIFEIRKNVGMVFQNPDNQMVASIVEEDVAFGPENLGVPQPQIVERVQSALEAVGMSEFAKNSPHKLSGGQKQRIAIAGALAIRPQVLVLDESTAMLDPQGRKEVLEVAHKLNGEGMTVILITHFMEEVLDCDSVVVMNCGHVVATGEPMQIFENSALLEQVGLKPPRTVELARKLKENGIDVEIVTDAEKLGGDVCRLLRKI